MGLLFAGGCARAGLAHYPERSERLSTTMQQSGIIPGAMNRRRAQGWVFWLLPLLAARLLLPVGVMPAAGSQGPALMLCSGGFLATALADSASRRDATQRGSSDAGGSCPFAAAGLLAPPLAATLPALALATAVAAPPALSAQRGAQFGPLRSQLSRAPPALI